MGRPTKTQRTQDRSKYKPHAGVKQRSRPPVGYRFHKRKEVN